MDSGSPFGMALREPLASTGPIRDGAPFNLEAWLRALDTECSVAPPAPVTSASSLPRGTPGADDATQTLHPNYVTAFASVFSETCGAAAVVAAFSDGTLASLAPDAETLDAWDSYIRRNPPVWTRCTEGLDSAVDEATEFARVCAELYTTLRSGFDVLPQGTAVETPTETRNYHSVAENIDDVRTEVARLRQLGHLITWATAQQRHPSLRRKRRPDHVLALGVVVKRRPSGEKKTRLVIDPSRATARSDGREVLGINDELPLPSCRLPTVQQASRAMFPRCWFFLADIVDAYLCTKHSVDSLRLMGVLLDDVLLTYDSLCFGLKTAPAHQQRLATVFSRIVLRRWAAAGLSIGAVPGHELVQPFPEPGDRLCYLFAYLDDFCGIGFATKAEADTAYEIFCAAADELGLPLQYADNKVVPPTQKAEFLGVVFCSRTQTLSLTAERVAKMAADLDALDAAATISVADLQSLVGVFMFTTVVFSLCRPFLRRMLNVLKAAGPNPPKRRQLPITTEAREDIDMWRRILGILRLNSQPVHSVPLRRRTVRAELYSDASFYGGAYFWGGVYRFWRWDSDIRERIAGSADDAVFICELEALALLQAIRDLAPMLLGRRGKGGQRLVCHIDNDPLVSMLTKHSSRSAACTPVLRELTGILLAYGLELAPVWIASAANEVADKLSRADELSAAELLETVRRWSAAHPDVSAWSRDPPLRPEMLETFDRHEFRPRGSPSYGVRHAQAELAADRVCVKCGADPCECTASVHRTWTRSRR